MAQRTQPLMPSLCCFSPALHLHLFCPFHPASLSTPCCFLSLPREQPGDSIWCLSSCTCQSAQQPRRYGQPPGARSASWRCPWQVGPDLREYALEQESLAFPSLLGSSHWAGQGLPSPRPLPSFCTWSWVSCTLTSLPMSQHLRDGRPGPHVPVSHSWWRRHRACLWR